MALAFWLLGWGLESKPAFPETPIALTESFKNTSVGHQIPESPFEVWETHQLFKDWWAVLTLLTLKAEIARYLLSSPPAPNPNPCS